MALFWVDFGFIFSTLFPPQLDKVGFRMDSCFVSEDSSSVRFVKLYRYISNRSLSRLSNCFFARSDVSFYEWFMRVICGNARRNALCGWGGGYNYCLCNKLATVAVRFNDDLFS